MTAEPAADRHRARPVDLAEAPEVQRLLDGLGLGRLLPDRVVSYNGRNDNWSGTTTHGVDVFVKRLGGPAADAARRLRNLLAFEELLATAPRTAGGLRGPRCLGWSEADLLVAFALVPSAVSGAERADAGDFTDQDAFRVGAAIGTLHGLDHARRTALDTSPPPLPPTAPLTALPLERHRTASAAELRLWSILQQDEELAAGIRALREREAEADPCPVHGDFRLDQLLFTDEVVHLLDCEELRRADPARDIGAYVGEWLHRAVGKLPGPCEGTGSDPAGTAPSTREMTGRATRELTRTRPLIERFRAGYASAGTALAPAVRERAAAFAGWHLIDRVLAQSVQRSTLTPVQRAALGIARTLLLSPAAVTTTLGLED
ncbi:class V lanthionine synthetase subunit LxmK [Streptomyces sp. SudanB91_2054]|uniref:class V lanthionine synthetase subunit LxmK n=1 Tax=Streptomyces sp. SudanB91_2054 TaxID=3035278 RepID=UPI0036DF2A54